MQRPKVLFASAICLCFILWPMFTPAQSVTDDNKTLRLFDGKTLDGWMEAQNTAGAAPGWIVKDGVMASTGTSRGVLYTEKDFENYRLIFTVRHVSGKPDHHAGILIFCTRPEKGEKPLDALGGIQFQVPNASHWDYRPGKNNSGKDFFKTIQKPTVNVHEWSRIEILVNAQKGTARMAVAQPVGSKAIEVLRFEDPVAGKVGPIAWQMHNAGLFDEYKDITLEVDPPIKELITVEKTDP